MHRHELMTAGRVCPHCYKLPKHCQCHKPRPPFARIHHPHIEHPWLIHMHNQYRAEAYLQRLYAEVHRAIHAFNDARPSLQNGSPLIHIEKETMEDCLQACALQNTDMQQQHPRATCAWPCVAFGTFQKPLPFAPAQSDLLFVSSKLCIENGHVRNKSLPSAFYIGPESNRWKFAHIPSVVMHAAIPDIQPQKTMLRTEKNEELVFELVWTLLSMHLLPKTTYF